MAVKLAPNEQLVKKWVYASDKTSRAEYILLVTDRRIVACNTGRRHSHHVEIANEDIAGIETGYDTKAVKAGIWVLLLGLIAVVCGIFSHYVISIAGAVLAVVGIVLMCVLKKAKLTISIYSKSRHENVFNMGLSSFSAESKRRRERVVKIVVNWDVAQEIVETLGSIVLVK